MSLEAIASALPSRVESAADIARQTGADEAFVRDKVGVARRHLLGDGETGLTLSAAAARRLLARTGLGADAVDLLVVVTQTPERRIPHNAPALAAALGLATRCASFDLALGCSGFVYGLAVVEGFLAATGRECAVLVTCDPYSRIMAAEDRATAAVFGDAATATLVRRAGAGARLGGLDFGTDGAGADAIRIAGGGAAAPFVALGLAATQHYGRDALRLHMDGREVFNFVNTRIPASIAASLAAAGLTPAQIDWFALHQGSAYMLQALARRAEIPPEKLLVNIDRYGNTVSSTIPLLLEELIGRGAAAGARVLLSGFGVGLSWATGVLEFPPAAPGAGAAVTDETQGRRDE